MTGEEAVSWGNLRWKGRLTLHSRQKMEGFKLKRL